jgi:DNA topoisomerase VI subunit B
MIRRMSKTMSTPQQTFEATTMTANSARHRQRSVRNFVCLAVCAAAGLGLTLSRFAVSQMPPQPNGGLPGAGRTSGGFPAMPENANPHPDGVRALQDMMQSHESLKRIEELNALRQKELTSDTARLVALASEVKDAAAATKEAPTMTEVQKVEQIEKLAHQVQQKMKATVTFN